MQHHTSFLAIHPAEQKSRGDAVPAQKQVKPRGPSPAMSELLAKVNGSTRYSASNVKASLTDALTKRKNPA
ncbi:hypothetical protein [Xylophilus rhododendri]|nr:hypothetical protein [Xylophilus rhododendri]